MRAKSSEKPEQLKINVLKNGQAELMLADNILQTDEGFLYDLYMTTMPYKANLHEIIKNNFEVWLEYAKRLQSEVPYTKEQLLQQEITSLQLENIELGQQITDLELKLLEE